MNNEDTTDYGPLAALIGSWSGEGLDIAPEPDGTEENPYSETILFEAAGSAKNAESQELAVVRYHQVVTRKSDECVFHDQVGYWMWDAEAGVVIQSLTIPRAVAVLAGGSAAPDSQKLTVRAREGDPDWGVLQSPFMRDNARTVSYENELTVAGDTLRYAQTTMLEIYGRSFEHTDQSKLGRC